MSKYAICKAHPQLYDAWAKLAEIPAEQAALGELSQEEQDAVVCLRAGRFELYEEKPFTSNWIVHSEKSSHSRPTRAEALRALAEAVEERDGE